MTTISGSQLVMPLLVINMGGEMMYILHQRLQAQNVPSNKAQKVLQDVVRSMYGPLFIDELFRPQDMYSCASTKQIFEKLAHSSIMRLNRNSMDKLYDLMTMGTKYQIISCAAPQQILHITLQHLESIKKFIEDASEFRDLLQVAIDKILAQYTELTMAQWIAIKQTMLRFYEGKRIKVSLYLKQNRQTQTGVLVLSNAGKLPFGTEVPGTIRYLEGGSVVRTKKFASSVTKYEINKSSNSSIGGEGQASSSSSGGGNVLCVEVKSVLDLDNTLGLNMYAVDEASALAPSSSYALAESMMKKAWDIEPGSGAWTRRGGNRSGGGLPGWKTPQRVVTQATAKAELNMLADLLGLPDESKHSSRSMDGNRGSKALGGGGSSSDAKGSFRMNLNPNEFFNSREGKGADTWEDDGLGDFIQIEIDGAADAKTMEAYMRDLDFKDDDDGPSTRAAAKGTDDDDEDDLLALLDSAK